MVAVAACGDDGPPRRPAAVAAIESEVDTVPASTATSDGRSRQSPVPLTADPAEPVPTVESMSPADPTTTAPTTVAPTTQPATTTTTQPPRSEPRRVLVIGDSSAAGMRWTGGATTALRGARFTLDLESCRRLVEPSCNGREGYTPSTALDALRFHALGGHASLIMVTGYNDLDRNFDAAFDLIVAEARAQGIDTILWATYREDVGYQLPNGASSAYNRMNEALALRVLSGQYPELRLLDWWAYTRDAPHWLSSDGVHFPRAGAFGMADFITRTLAALDRRPCPVPWELLTEPADPCPPPLEELERRGSVPGVMLLYGS